MRLAAILAVATGLAHACTCIAPDVRHAKKRAEIVFRGRITGFRDTGNGKFVVFAVDRVWKGDVPRTFEMPAFKESTACLGFWPNFLEVGKDLLVYAYRLAGVVDYLTDVCSRTALAEESKDFAKLGSGRAPKSN